MDEEAIMRQGAPDGRASLILAGFVIAVATILRLWNLTDLASLNLHVIRQMIGAMQSRNIALGHTGWLEPSIDVAWFPSDPPWFVSLELPLVPWLTAGLYNLFGVHVWFGNALSVLFSAAAAWFFFLIARRLCGSDSAALLALLPFVFLPEAYKYSRLIQPDSLSLLALLSLVYAAVRWVDEERRHRGEARRGWYWFAVVSLAFLLANKINYAPLALVPLGVIVSGLGWKRIVRADVLGGAALSAVPAVAWYTWAMSAAEFDQFGVLVSDSVFMRLASNWRDPLFWAAVGDGVEGWLFVPGIVLVLTGLALVLRARREHNSRVLLLWTAATGLYLYIAGPDLLAPHRYYFLPLLPVACLLMGVTCKWLLRRGALRALGRTGIVHAGVAGLAVMLALGSGLMLRGYYAETREEMNTFEAAAELVRTHTEPDDLVVIETEDWGVTLLVAYLSERQGWTRLNSEQLTEVSSRGATYAFVSSAPYAEKYFDSASEADVFESRRQTIEDSGARIVTGGAEGVLYRLENAGASDGVQ